MTKPFTELVQDIRRSGRLRAGAALLAQGYLAQGADWVGSIALKDGSSVPVLVRLPEQFPDALPEIHLRSVPNAHLAHVERSGKICIAPTTGTLIDADRPEAIIFDALSRAVDVLNNKNSPQQTNEILAEFLAYWADPAVLTVLSICPPDRVSGPACVGQLGGTPATALFAADGDAVRAWSQATGKALKSVDDAFFVRLRTSPPPPPFGSSITLRELLELVEAHALPGAKDALRAWLVARELPAVVVLSAPLGRAGDDVVFGAVVPQLSTAEASAVQKGFRPGKVPPELMMKRVLSNAITRIEVARADPGFVLPRGGADLRLRDRTVALIGCGSVGSYLAQALAAHGVGTLILIDPETLVASNLHRHVLGAAHLGVPKTIGLQQVLLSRFPHLVVRSFSQSVQQVLDTDPAEVLSSDLVISAMGHETLERRLNGLFVGQVRRLHVWLEPFGVGGHVLSLSDQRAGCFNCLFRDDPIFGLVNMASLVLPGQNFQRSLGGCSGTFTPFGPGDAEQAALNACREAVAVLRDKERPHVLLSWVASAELFLAEGFRLSPRGKALAPERLYRTLEFVRPDCRICSGGAA